MHLNKDGSLNLFISIALALFMLILVSLPGFAGTSTDTSPSISGTYTPTIYTDISPSGDQNDPSIPTQTPEIISTSTPSSPTPTLLTTFTGTISDTLTPLPTNTSSPTVTPTPFITPTESSGLQSTTITYFPFLSMEIFVPPSPPETVLYCDNLSQSIVIPDNNPNGVNDDISISDGRLLVNLSLYLDISHSWVGDLVVTLTNQNTGDTITVLDRPGNPSGSCSNDNIITILDDGAAQPADKKCADSPKAISGIYLPSEALSVFSGSGVSGTWRLNVSDRYPNDTGSLNHWCLETLLANPMPPPTPTPTPVNLPSSAYVNGMSGQKQQLRLDCESRSAVDWAKHFGFNIDEFDFLNHLPSSDDPEAGFVGNPDGEWGNIPPADYGVHAPPVAALLRNYGATASSFRSLQWDDVRAEIASGNPAIVWIIGDDTSNLVNGIPHFYTPLSTGNTTIVAPYEHTVVVVGYSPDSVTVLNGSRFVDIRLDQFLDSWSVLQFMAVLARP